ncbi:MAG TPA: hypothetical protein ENJ35_04315 [Gammaproteobacteria bacterium]|nr:hypothetical protein [Gammaproteobacteria bacterium]
MNKGLTTKRASTDLATGEVLYVLNLRNMHVFPWTPLLAVDKDFVDCNEYGEPLRKEDIPGDHPWIREQTQELHSMMKGAGADAVTLYDMGQSLTEQARAKYHSLNYDRAKEMLLEKKVDITTGNRVIDKIERMANAAIREIRAMADAARRRFC